MKQARHGSSIRELEPDVPDGLHIGSQAAFVPAKSVIRGGYAIMRGWKRLATSEQAFRGMTSRFLPKLVTLYCIREIPL